MSSKTATPTRTTELKGRKVDMLSFEMLDVTLKNGVFFIARAHFLGVVYVFRDLFLRYARALL